MDVISLTAQQEAAWRRAFPGDGSKHIWRLYINSGEIKDPTNAAAARLTYDNHLNPGFAQGMDAAYAFVKSTLFQPLTTDWLRQLHDIAVDGVIQVGAYGTERRPMKKGYHPGCDYSLRARIRELSAETLNEWRSEKFILWDRDVRDHDTTVSYTRAGYNVDEFLAFILPKGVADSLDWMENNLAIRVHSTFCRDPWLFPDDLSASMAKIEGVFARYRTDVASARSPAEIRRACSRVAVALCIHHNFPDGNYRTDKAVLDKLLIENGQFPCILPTCAYLGGAFRIDEVAAAVEQGQKAFEETVKGSSLH